MMTETLPLYDIWDVQLPAVPPRSRLYALEPVGVGTAQVESLTSYIARLAEAHSVPLGKLMLKEILPLYGRSYLPGNMTVFWTRQARALNGVGEWARDMIKSLEQLTGQGNLRFLSCLPWAEVISARGLLRQQRAWCPACLAQQRQAGETIYEPLLWAFQVITLCPDHHQRLFVHCPHCHKSLPWLARSMRVGYCSRCRQWLGRPVATPENKERGSSSEMELEWHNWVGQAVGELLAAGPGLSSLPGQDSLAQSLAIYMERVTGGQKGLFSRRLQDHHVDLDKMAIWRWLNGSQPLFSRLLQVCYCLQTTPLHFLTEPSNLPASLDLKALPAQTPPASIQKSFNRLDLDLLRQALEATLASEEEPPPSLNQVAKQLGYAGHTQLGRRLPELSQAVSARYREYWSGRSLERKQLIEDEVRQRTFEIHAEGRYPTLRQVMSRLSKPCYGLDPWVKAIWHEAVQQLGYEALERWGQWEIRP